MRRKNDLSDFNPAWVDKLFKTNRPQTALEIILNHGMNIPGVFGNTCRAKLMRRYLRRVSKAFNSSLKSLPRGTLCIDLGANVGEFSKLMLDHGMRVIAFEPDPQTFSVLKQNLSGYADIECRCEAAGTRMQTIELFRSENWTEGSTEFSKSSSIVYIDGKTQGANKVYVQEIDFAAFVKELNEPIGLLKVDIEGSEWTLVPHMEKAGVFGLFDFIFVETHEFLDPDKEPLAQQFRDMAARTAKPIMNFDWL